MKTFFSQFTNKPQKYDPVDRDVGADGDECCMRCGQSTNSILHSSKRPLIYVRIFLGMMFVLILSTIIHKAYKGVQRDAEVFIEIFGKVPIRSTGFMEDFRYVDSDPHDGSWDTARGYENTSVERPHTVWDDIYHGSWVSVPNPRVYGLPQSRPSREAESEDYVVSVLHQIHCIGELKHIVMAKGVGITPVLMTHASHCIEYLRQCAMCNADLTLEWPNNPKGTMGWGTTHQCRDWSVVRKLLSAYKPFNQ